MTDHEIEIIELDEKALEEDSGGVGSFIDPNGGERGAGLDPNG